MKKYALLAIISIPLFIYCGSDMNADTAKDNSQRTILAKVNGETLTLEDLKLQIPAEYRDQLRDEDIRDATETWINTQLLAQAGRKKGLEKDSDVQAVVKFRTSDAIARRLIDIEVNEKTAISPQEIDSIYNADRGKFKVDREQYRVSHILVATKDEADAIYKRLVKGDDFGKLARDYSVDRQSASADGDIGYFTLDQIDPDFGKAVEKLQIGAYTAPVQTGYGFHLIKLTDKMAAGSDLDAGEVKGKITEDLMSARRGQAFNSLIDSLRQEAKIERFGPAESAIPAMPDSV